MSDLQMALVQLDRAQSAYHRADSVFCGHQPEVFTSRRLEHALRHAGMKFRLNFARIPVVAVADRLEIASVRASDARSNAALQVIWEENQMDLWANSTHLEALKLGDTMIHVWPDESGFPGIHMASPVTTRIIYDPQQPRRKMLAINCWIEQWGALAGYGRADVYYPDRIERYVTTEENGHLTTDTEQWEPFLDDQNDVDGVLDNPYGEIPFFHFRTELPEGRPEHYDAYGAQDAINKHVTQQLAALDFASFPQRYLLSELGGNVVPSAGSMANMGNVLADDDDWDDNEVPIDSSANTTTNIQPGPGTMLEFIGTNLKIGEFTAADPDSFLKPLAFYVQAVADTTFTPIHMFRGMGDVPSGESLRAAEAPLLKKVRDRAQMFGATWNEALEFALKVVGIDAMVDTSWVDPQSVDSVDKWAVVAAKIAAGVPVEVALHEAGYPLEEVQLWLEHTTAPAAPAALDAAAAAPDAPGQTAPVDNTKVVPQ